MGGNVTIGTEKADRIQMSKFDRDDLVKELQVFMEAFEVAHDAKIEPSGSTRFLFNRNITSETLRYRKPSFGDIDFQIDQEKMPIKMKPGTTLGAFVLIGSKMTTNTLVTLWKFHNINVQIDFEGVEFENGMPTKWSQFAYSASWIDQMNDIKGVAHKYIFRALTARWLDDYPVRMRRGTKVKRTSIYAFSNKGLRKKLVATDHGEWIELKPEESVYIRDLELIFMMLISPDVKFDEMLELQMHSFCSVVDLIVKYVPSDEWVGIADSMAHLLWAPGAQEIDSNEAEDRRVKVRIMLCLAEQFDLPAERWDDIKAGYYGV